MSLLRKEKARQILLSVLCPLELQVKDGSTLVLCDPYGADVAEVGEGVGEVLELVPDQVQDGEVSQTREL